MARETIATEGVPIPVYEDQSIVFEPGSLIFGEDNVPVYSIIPDETPGYATDFVREDDGRITAEISATYFPGSTFSVESVTGVHTHASSQLRMNITSAKIESITVKPPEDSEPTGL